MSVQAIRALEFSTPAAAEQRIVPCTVYKYFFNAELAEQLANVCRSWRGFVNDVAQWKMRRFAVEGGMRLDPERFSPRRFLQIAIESEEELKIKISQFRATLEGPPANYFICYGPEGKGYLRLVDGPSHVTQGELDAVDRVDDFVFDPDDADETQYILIHPPNSATIKIPRSDSAAEEAMIDMPLMVRERDERGVFTEWQLQDLEMREEDAPRLVIEGAFPLQRVKEDVKIRLLSAIESVSKIRLKMQSQFSPFFAHLSPDIQLIMNEVLFIFLDVPCCPTVSTPYFIDELQELEACIEVYEKVCTCLDELLKDPKLCESLKGKLCADSLPISEMRALLEEYRAAKEEAPALESFIRSVNRQGDDSQLVRAYYSVDLFFQRIMKEVFAEHDTVRPILDRHLPGGLSKVLHAALAARGAVPVAPLPAAAPPPVYQALQPFIDIAVHASAKHHRAILYNNRVAAYKNQVAAQTRLANTRDGTLCCLITHVCAVGMMSIAAGTYLWSQYRQS